ncbi:MAG: nuclear transport factor 2 family protein [Chloroflexia bacterium]|nr:nuclear transport factor 2 family protein [Chloroflexia bacterium]
MATLQRITVLFPLAFVALLLATAFRAGTAARAQDATPGAAPDAIPPLLQEMVDAINATDSAALATLYTEDGAHEDVPAGVTARGREEIAAFVDATSGQFRDVRFAPVSARQAGDLAVLEYDFSVTDLASGKSLTYRGVLVFDLDGALIRRSADYYDLAAILGQLGQLEMDAVAAEATPAP